MNRKSCAFILSYGRPDRVLTAGTLDRYGYTGEWRIICSTDDDSLELYQENYPGKVVTFNKLDYLPLIRNLTNAPSMRSVLYARRASFDIARELGFTHFIQLDDDYTVIRNRYDRDGNYGEHRVGRLDELFELYFDFLDETTSASVALAQGGDFIGGKGNQYAKGEKVIRKVMNSWFCRTDRPIDFIGELNDDVNTYMDGGNLGVLFMTHVGASLSQGDTQQHSGGLTELYLEVGTYVKSMHTVMLGPSYSLVYPMHTSNPRLHHRIAWKNAVPKIVRHEP